MPIQEYFIEYQSKAHGHTLLLYSPNVCYIILAMLTKFVSVLLFIGFLEKQIGTYYPDDGGSIELYENITWPGKSSALTFCFHNGVLWLYLR